jgi:RNA recognition motif-containing protein
MIRAVLLSSAFCRTLPGRQFNSIDPAKEHVAFGHYFPKEWTEGFIREQMDPSGRQIKEIQLVRNKLGEPSGKVLLKFLTAQAMKTCIERYNEDFIITRHSTHRVVIQPFNLKTRELTKQTQQQKTKHMVKVKNLDFDITTEELERLGKDFGKVEHIEMHMRPNGLNNGLATMYFSSRTEA